MAAYFSFEIQNSIVEEDSPRYVGDTFVSKQWRNVVSVQVDGDELEFACKVVCREVKFRVFTFTEHEARLIAVNWC